MVIQRIAPEIFKYASRYIPRFAYKAKRFEDKMWKGLYPHKSSRWIVRGSLLAGDAARQIKDSYTPFDSG